MGVLIKYIEIFKGKSKKQLFLSPENDFQLLTPNPTSKNGLSQI